MVSPRTRVFCDFFNITTPKDNHDFLIPALQPFFASLGCSLTAVGYSCPSGGLFSHRFRGQVVLYSCSGAFITALRDSGQLALFLAEFAMFPHAVSSADLSVDEYAAAPAKIQAVFSIANTGTVSFTRKAVARNHVRSLQRLPHYHDDSGLLTGTVYIGQRGRHEVHMKVYDKRNETIERTGQDIGDRVRYELTVSRRMGVTLRDLVEPASCFYHFCPPSILEPEPTEPWAPMAEGYFLPKLEARLPSQVLKARAMDSPELRDLFRIADTIGSEGFKYLLSVVKQSYESYQSEIRGTA